MNHSAAADPISALAGRASMQVLPGGVLMIGRSKAEHDPDDPESLLTAYLSLVRKVRHQQREAAIVLRRDDITALSGLLGPSENEIIEQLGSLMGATRSQRRAMVKLFAAGALVIGVGGLTAATARAGHELSGTVAERAAIEVVVDQSDDTFDSVFAAMPAPELAAMPAQPAAATGRPEAADLAPLVAQAREAAARTDVVISDSVEALVGTAPAAAPAAPAATAPSAPAGVTDDVAATTPVVGSIPDTDPSLVDIGSPPVPVRPVTEIIEEPTLVIDPPAPGFGPGS